MRHGRAKAARKTLKFYSLTGKIKAPYKVLLDANFIVSCIRQKVPLHDRLGRLLQGEKFSLLVTRAALRELDSIIDACEEKGKIDVLTAAKQFGLDECEILEDHADASAGDSITNFVHEGNLEGYFIATQDEQLSDTLRGMPNVPILRLNRAVLLLEAPSAASRRNASSDERSKLFGMNEEEKQLVTNVKAHEITRAKAQEERRPKERLKPKAKNPNPLSCKKRKNETKSNPDGEKKKRRRRKKGTSSVDKNEE
mmetsp:Transcript_32732/g.47364  ORF Transcript_32732/g.47364 Transcript_32732/m.47364 type:complete len:254 (-) Transcript_32732:46-807(-)|eukprot:CAMPEP_0116009008 /NCGR_PEP_ID=MMETSP0321-20121206/3189_1 /TAXON_ID=163516 /ORGANISM="Leptocylindrus danicus var. danicus, Strain B650" /LENGTH=253 /DNA_ID=CAMNT_0003477913 /DNA_START=39 /DNA_END=800 /DNA_ORIENTATION=-